MPGEMEDEVLPPSSPLTRLASRSAVSEMLSSVPDRLAHRVAGPRLTHSVERLDQSVVQRDRAKVRWRKAGQVVRSTIRLKNSLSGEEQKEQKEQAAQEPPLSGEDEEDQAVVCEYSLSHRIKVAGLVCLETLGGSLLKSVALYPKVLLAGIFAEKDFMEFFATGKHSSSDGVLATARSLGARGLYKGFWLFASCRAASALLHKMPAVYLILQGKPLTPRAQQISYYSAVVLSFGLDLVCDQKWMHLLAGGAEPALADVPVWVVVSRACNCYFWAQKEVTGSYAEPPTHMLPFLVAPSHPLREHRPLLQLMRATPPWLPRFVLMPLVESQSVL